MLTLSITVAVAIVAGYLYYRLFVKDTNKASTPLTKDEDIFLKDDKIVHEFIIGRRGSITYQTPSTCSDLTALKMKSKGRYAVKSGSDATLLKAGVWIYKPTGGKESNLWVKYISQGEFSVFDIVDNTDNPITPPAGTRIQMGYYIKPTQPTKKHRTRKKK